MNKKLADGISLVFHPVLMPFYGSLLLLFNDVYLSLLLTSKSRLTILAVIFVITVVVPVMLIILMKRAGWISSLRIDKREERSVPFLAVGFAMYLAYMLIKSFEIPGYYSLFLLGGTLLVVIALAINSFWKISIHMLALGGLSGLLIATAAYRFGADSFFIYLLILISGLTGSARLSVSTHSPAQVYVGFLSGLAFMFALVKIFT